MPDAVTHLQQCNDVDGRDGDDGDDKSYNDHDSAQYDADDTDFQQ